MRVYVLSLLCLLSISVFANPIDGNCHQFVKDRAPIAKQALIYVCHKEYAVALDPSAKIPKYTVEVVTKDHIVKNFPRSNAFKLDPMIDPKYQASLLDYVGSGYDKGHMTPDGDFVSDRQAEAESFYMSNMVPQNPHNNRGIWKKLEEHIRSLTATNSKIYVITGPVYEDVTSKKIGNGVVVPDMLWKIVLLDRGIEVYLMPNEGEDLTLDKFRSTMLEIQLLTGLQF